MNGTPAITALAVPLSSAAPVRDRLVPVDEPFASMLPDGGLQRGRVVGCDGAAAFSTAVALVAGAVRAGSWMLLLGASGIGLEAIAELGIPLHRVVAVDVEAGPAAWAERAAVAADGFEVILAVPPAGAERVERRIRQRLQARGAVLVSVGATARRFGCDVTLTTSSPRWVGVGQGHGRLIARQVDVVVAGRRVPRPVHRSLWLPGPDGRVSLVAPAAETLAGEASFVEARSQAG